ncbi:hypothetical protein ACVWW3_001370 [Bradyrhizobium sp. LM2.9]
MPLWIVPLMLMTPAEMMIALPKMKGALSGVWYPVGAVELQFEDELDCAVLGVITSGWILTTWK